MIPRPNQRHSERRNNSRNIPEGDASSQQIDESTSGYSDEFEARKRMQVFPFTKTPSGNFKVSSNQIVFETKKVSVLVSNPSGTTVNLNDEYGSNCKSITIRDGAKKKSLYGLCEKTPEFSQRATFTSYEEPDNLCREDFADREKDLRIVRKGVQKATPIDWQHVNIPPKTNLQHLLLQRIKQCIKPDTYVRIGSMEFYCHALVLQSYSHYFDDIKLEQMKEPIDLPDTAVTPEAFHIVYGWMISDQSSQLLSQDSILEVYMAAEYLRIDELKLQCWAFLDSEDLFAEDTAFVMFMQAKAVGNKDVMQVMMPRIMKFFLALVSSRDFLELEIAEITMILQSNHICVHSEIEVFMAAVRWLTYNWEERQEYLEELMSCIRFGLIASWQLVDIRRNPENPHFIEVTRCEEVRKMVEDGLAYSIIKNWYSGIAQDYCNWINILGLTEPTPRNWVGEPIAYITYKQFVKDLHVYRHAYMSEQKLYALNGVANTGKLYELPILPIKAGPAPTMPNPFPVGPPGHEMNPPPEALAHLLARRDYLQEQKSQTSQLENLDRGDFVHQTELKTQSRTSVSSAGTENMETLDIGVNSERSMKLNLANPNNDMVYEKDCAESRTTQGTGFGDVLSVSSKGRRKHVKNSSRSHKHSLTSIQEYITSTVHLGNYGITKPQNQGEQPSATDDDDQSVTETIAISLKRSTTCVNKCHVGTTKTLSTCSVRKNEYNDDGCQTECNTLMMEYEQTVDEVDPQEDDIPIDRSSSTIDHQLEMKRFLSDTEKTHLYESETYSSKSSSYIGCKSRSHNLPNVMEELSALKLNPRNSYLLYHGQSKASMQYLMRKRVLGLPDKHLVAGSLFLEDHESVLVFGGVDPHMARGNNMGKHIFRFVPEYNVWEVIGELPEPRMHHAVVFHKGKVFLAGGADHRVNDMRGKSIVVSTMWSFDPVTRCWISEASMLTPRKCFGLVALQGKLYAVGGQDSRGRAMKSVERFDPKTGVWVEMSPLSFPRLGIAVAVYQGMIWVAGGMTSSISNPVCGEVECYNPALNEWRFTTPLKFPRTFARFMVENEKLYIIGGAGCVHTKSSAKTSLQDIDVWDDATQQWSSKAHLAIPRHGHSVAYLGSQILIMCGVTTAYMRAVNNVEAYCCKRGRWVKGIKVLPVSLSGLGSITLPPANLIQM